MKKLWQKIDWIAGTVLGSAAFALGFALFLDPNDINTGGVSGLAMVLRQLLGFGSVGMLTMLINIPLFLVGGAKIGKKFFVGSFIGMVLSSVLIDVFAMIPWQAPESTVSSDFLALFSAS